MGNTESARLAAHYGNRMGLPVHHPEQGDVLLIGAEVQEVVVTRVLITPDDPRRLALTPVDDFELNAQIAVTAQDFVVNRQPEFIVAPVLLETCANTLWWLGAVLSCSTSQ